MIRLHMKRGRNMHYVSLGYFCSIASELEELGFRSESLPFDWLISDFEGIINAILEQFEGFLEYENMAQNKRELNHYKNIKYNIEFFHDFNQYQSLEKQLTLVKKKYARRIERFYKLIKEPTIFIRYISDEVIVDGKSKELMYIEENYEFILQVLQSFNQNNRIIFVANHGVISEKINIYNVEKDFNDQVARKPFNKNAALYKVLDADNFPNREENIRKYNKKQYRRNCFCYRFSKRIVTKFKKTFFKEYIHIWQYQNEII